MTAKKTRPAPGAALAPGMSLRDVAAACSIISVSQLERACRVAEIPAAEFEALVESDNPPTVTQLVALGRRRRAEAEGRAAPVSLPRRVSRALALVKAMTPEERAAFAAALQAGGFTMDREP